MRVHELVSDSQPILKVTDSVQRALEKMEDHKVFQLPLIEDGKYLGMLSETHLLDYPNPAQTLDQLVPGFTDIYANGTQHMFDLAHLLSEHQLTAIAVLDHEKNFLGTVLIHDLLFEIGKRKEFESGDTIISILAEIKGFSLSDITRIIESNGGKIVYLGVNPIENDVDHLKVTIKLQKVEISRVIAAIERYEFKIIDKYLEDQVSDENYDRLNHLFKYLDM